MNEKGNKKNSSDTCKVKLLIGQTVSRLCFAVAMQGFYLREVLFVMKM